MSMDRDTCLRHKQRRVAAGMAAALLLTLVVLAFALWLGGTGGAEPFSDRLRTALALDLFYLVWLGASVANVARLRFLSAEDIDGSSHGQGSQRVRDANAVLHNTLEQTVLAIGAQMVLVAALARATPVLIALAGLFFLGRLLFWIGYRHGAAGRALGFALTFYPSMAGLVIGAAALLTGLWTM